MKRILLSLLAPVAIGGMFTRAFAQNELDPCCSIIARDIQKNTMVARDNKTGRLYQFKADALDMKAINLNDAVNISGGKVSAISGAKRTYVTVRPDPLDPCCSIVSIQPDPIDPCCSMVNIMNNTTNTNSAISVPKQIAATLKTGQAVSMDGASGLAIVHSAYGSSNGQMNAYGYGATSGNNTKTNTGTSTDKWVITSVPAMKGVLGKLNMNFPAGLDWNVGNLAITQLPDNKYITSFSGNALQTVKSYNIAPGEYLIHLNNLPVENVPIQKGYETRIKTGILNVVSEGGWEIYNESKEMQLTSYNKPLKFVLPVGSYQLKLSGQFYPVLIKDGETVEY